MAERASAVRLAIVLAAVVLLPLAGAWLRDPATAIAALAFPPALAIPRDYPRWSWAWCGGVLTPMLVMAVAWQRSKRQRPIGKVPPVTRAAFPGWGWVGAGWTVAWWVLAWNRFSWFAALQRYTFFPLWIGFILVVNALTERRGRRCRMRASPRRWVALFATSAAFWWLFEWLNRFARNWHYLGVQDIGPVAYALHASLCFSTVLPAVLAVREFLATVPSLQAVLAAGPRFTWLVGPTRGAIIAGLGTAGLVLTGAFPQYFYPALWLAPLALYAGSAAWSGLAGFWTQVARGDWQRAGSWALAAVVCGVWWELWNVRSAAKWIYTVPFVDRWHVFEMPVLGYTGYFAFGLECGIVAAAVLGVDASPISAATEPER